MSGVMILGLIGTVCTSDYLDVDFPYIYRDKHYEKMDVDSYEAG